MAANQQEICSLRSDLQQAVEAAEHNMDELDAERRRLKTANADNQELKQEVARQAEALEAQRNAANELQWGLDITEEESNMWEKLAIPKSSPESSSHANAQETISDALAKLEAEEVSVTELENLRDELLKMTAERDALLQAIKELEQVCSDRSPSKGLGEEERQQLVAALAAAEEQMQLLLASRDQVDVAEGSDGVTSEHRTRTAAMSEFQQEVVRQAEALEAQMNALNVVTEQECRIWENLATPGPSAQGSPVELGHASSTSYVEYIQDESPDKRESLEEIVEELQATLAVKDCALVTSVDRAQALTVQIQHLQAELTGSQMAVRASEEQSEELQEQLDEMEENVGLKEEALVTSVTSADAAVKLQEALLDELVSSVADREQALSCSTAKAANTQMQLERVEMKLKQQEQLVLALREETEELRKNSTNTAAMLALKEHALSMSLDRIQLLGERLSDLLEYIATNEKDVVETAGEYEQLQDLLAASEHKETSLENALDHQVAANDLLKVCSRCVCAQCSLGVYRWSWTQPSKHSSTWQNWSWQMMHLIRTDSRKRPRRRPSSDSLQL